MTFVPILPARRGLLLAAAALAVLAIAPGCGAAVPDVAPHLVQVQVLDRDGAGALPVYRDHGRPVVAGRPGARYAVRLRNTSGQRVLAVVAIDGVNVVTGETAGVGQRGYVLEPWQSTEITGWRKSDDEVAAFEFTSLANSYAARTGRPNDVGVIGVAVFLEAPAMTEITTAPPSARLGAMSRALPAQALPAAPAPAATESARAKDAGSGQGLADAARAPPRDAPERLGTGHGARETSVVRAVTFQRASARPDQRLEIRYDSLDNLIAAGIVPPPRVATTTPHAFPADPPRDYVPDPPLR